MSSAGLGRTRPVRADARRNRARILEAAEAVFAEQGASASTDAVAERAGVAIGTVFRHFPTKPDLLRAVVMSVQDHIAAEVDVMVLDQVAPTALFDFCSLVMEAGAAHRDVFERLVETGVQARVSASLARMRPAIDVLLERARDGRAVRHDLSADELIALLAAVCQEAMAGDWSGGLRRRALSLLFGGMRPTEAGL
ncbi:transcriptional regulator, TetR family [Streptomyces sp. 2131.1]|uniref:TetR/AcrR family transcriptional regulator n=1 Tax=Streptomyces sp. 2131.1 TaxID=1855346 RepID=UPI00089B16EA|nr:TetR/AcrR family transcriptional regulator [Streptomyces sp. 2131.1]SEE45573.1 transcriptional regulator, TetR family [Streptomyces sp. 2131.1]